MKYDEAPTAPSWIVAALAEIEAQRDRLLSGIACPVCRGAAHLATRGRTGVTWTACFACDGFGVRK